MEEFFHYFRSAIWPFIDSWWPSGPVLAGLGFIWNKRKKIKSRAVRIRSRLRSRSYAKKTIASQLKFFGGGPEGGLLVSGVWVSNFDAVDVKLLVAPYTEKYDEARTYSICEVLSPVKAERGKPFRFTIARSEGPDPPRCYDYCWGGIKNITVFSTKNRVRLVFSTNGKTQHFYFSTETFGCITTQDDPNWIDAWKALN